MRTRANGNLPLKRPRSARESACGTLSYNRELRSLKEVREMIYTVTFNPSLDYVVGLDKFIPGTVNRAASEHIYPGGKGINVPWF